MPQRSSIRWLPLPPHTVLGAQVPSIAMATVGAVDGEGCLEWQPWQEPGPSNDPGGREGDEDGEEERREPGKRSMPIQSRVIMVARFKGVCTPTSVSVPLERATREHRDTVKILKWRTRIEDMRCLISRFFTGACFLSSRRRISAAHS